MKNSLKELFSGFWSLVVGMRITLRQFFQPVVTVKYPHESLKMPARFRGHIELVRDPETGKAVCFACKLCERACPSDCITVEGAKLEGAKKRSVVAYRLDFTKCSLCGSCVEACRDGAIRYSHEFNLASTNKDDFVMDLFKRLEAERTAAEPRAAGGQSQGPQPESAAVPSRAGVLAPPIPATGGPEGTAAPKEAAVPAAAAPGGGLKL